MHAPWIVRREGRFHHAIEPDDDGGLWSWRDEPEAIVRFDAATGEVTREIYLEDIVAADGGHYGELAIHAAEDARELRYLGDAFHPNDVEPLRADLAGAFPMFEAGDLFVENLTSAAENNEQAQGGIIKSEASRSCVQLFAFEEVPVLYGLVVGQFSFKENGNRRS